MKELGISNLIIRKLPDKISLQIALNKNMHILSKPSSSSSKHSLDYVEISYTNYVTHFGSILTSFIHVLFGQPLAHGGPSTYIKNILFINVALAALHWTCPNISDDSLLIYHLLMLPVNVIKALVSNSSFPSFTTYPTLRL